MRRILFQEAYSKFLNMDQKLVLGEKSFLIMYLRQKEKYKYVL